MVLFIALVVVLASCDIGTTYWNPGQEYAGKPVANSFGMISKPLHDEFAACGLTDQDIIDTIHNYGGGTITTTKYTINPDGSVGKGVDITITAVAAGAFELTCRPHK
jgi:hypothetical protein